MDAANEDYWYNQWHLDVELHRSLNLNNISQIPNSQKVSIYADTDSLFVSFKPAMKHCDWINQYLNDDYIISIQEKFAIVDIENVQDHLSDRIYKSEINNVNYFGKITDLSTIDQVIKSNNVKILIVDGSLFYKKEILELKSKIVILPNFRYELDFIQGIDKERYGKYFAGYLDDYAAKFGVENKEEFELERISESIINIAKKKYIQNISYEDNIPFDKLSYIYPKGVEIIRSSTPLFARDKIVNIIKYLFMNPDTFNIRDLLKLVKNLKKEFDLCVPDKIDEISMQSSVNKYDEKVLDDKKSVSCVGGAHFSVKAACYFNYLLNQNTSLNSKYEHIKSGKIKYYYCKDKSMNEIFAYARGSYPIEFAPDIDLDTQFEKCILSPINSIIEPLGLPLITKRLSVVMSIFGDGF